MENSYNELISSLKILYGVFDETQKRFEKAPNSEIARDLGYSDAQFSRLVHESATEGEYARAIKNAKRILSLLDLEKRLQGISARSKLKSALTYTTIAILSIFIGFGLSDKYKPSTQPGQSKYDMLRWAFESNLRKPYKSLRDLPIDCNFECYKYQGRWELENKYKFPFLRESGGFHYLAKSVVSYARCAPKDNPEGKLIQGYEYQEHEIWYDIQERSIGKFIQEDGEPLPSYQKLEFSKSAEFIKIGTIHTFYTNDFKLDATLIYREGDIIGRDIEFATDDELAESITDPSLIEKIKREMVQIVQDPIQDFSQPSHCNPAPKSQTDFHAIANGDAMVFNCQMSAAHRFSINYTKTYVLKDQFIKDKCISRIEQ